MLINSKKFCGVEIYISSILNNYNFITLHCKINFLPWFLNFRLEVKTGRDHIDLIYDTNSIKEIKRIEVKNPNQSEAWENGDWEQQIDDDDLQGLIRLKSLKDDQVYDIRLIGRGENREIKMLTQNGVKVGGLFIIIILLLLFGKEGQVKMQLQN